MSVTDPTPPPANATGAGAPIVLSIVGGTVIGFLLRQPTVGFLIGIVAGITIATLLWMKDRASGR